MKDPKRQAQGLMAKRRGAAFEERLNQTFAYYRSSGAASITKTPEPMRPLQNLGGGTFKAVFASKAEPDYKGILKGGREVMFEAKFTGTDRIEQSRVLPQQAEYMDEHARLGARCYVLVGFDGGNVYRVPWADWQDMKARFGRKYAKEEDLKPYICPVAPNGVIELI